LIFRKANAGELDVDSGLMALFDNMTEIDVDAEGVIYGMVCLIQHYVIKFVNCLRQVGGFLWLPPLIKLTATIKLKYH
jgi:hypothetical protein